MVKIKFLAHDYIEFTDNKKRYTLDLKHDKFIIPMKWQKEIDAIEKSNIVSLRKKYKIQTVNKTIKDDRPDFLKKFF